jgi:DNA-binding NtrC family response regulator
VSILIADDEKGIRLGLGKLFDREGFETCCAETAEEALRLVGERDIRLALLDIRLGSSDGLTLLSRIKELSPETVCIMITGYGSIDNAVQAMKIGAADYLLKPLDNEHILKTVRSQSEITRLRNENTLLKQEQQKRMTGFDFQTRHEGMRKIMDIADRVKDTDSTVLIGGESGTGKEVLSRYIHFSSNRSEAPFVGVNCAALSETLLLSELFGHEKGSFTGADERKIGKFELADRGTLFLDEIGDMSLDAQAKLLRVLEEGSLERLGGNKTIRVNIRVIAASNHDLLALIGEKKFREDLYYRLNVIRLDLPPLRERREDIIPLAEYFSEFYAGKYRKGELSIPEGIRNNLKGYGWPGNIRELKNMINQAVLLSDGGILAPAVLTATASSSAAPEAETPPKQEDRYGGERGDLSGRMERVIEEHEKQIIRSTLERSRYNKTAAAEELGISRKTLFNKMNKYNL